MPEPSARVPEPLPARPPSHRRALDQLSERQLVRRWWTTPCSLRQLAREFGVSHMTVYRLVQAAARPV